MVIANHLHILEEIGKILFDSIKGQVCNVSSEWRFSRELSRRAAGVTRTVIISARTAA